MTQMIPFETSKVPAYLKPKGTVVNPFAAAVSAGGFPVVSIKGKVWHISRGDEKVLVTKPDAEDEPASSLEVVIVAAGSGKSKVYYVGGYVEGSTDKPACYSNDGVAPAADAATPQAKKCAICAHNVWGSKVTESGKQSKACSDSWRLAVAPAGQLNDPMLLRVPAASLKALGEYGSLLAKRGVEMYHVVTKIGFDYTVAHPALTFKPIGLVSESMLAEIEETRESEVTKSIIGAPGTPGAAAEPADEPFEQYVPPAIEAPKPKRAASLDAAVANATPVAAVKVEDDEPVAAPAPVAKKAKPAAAPAPVTATVAELEAGLTDIDFDD